MVLKRNMSLLFRSLLLMHIALMGACSKQDASVALVKVTMPYFSGCEDTIGRLAKGADRSAAHNGWIEGVELSEFNVTPLSHPELKGYLVIFMQKDAKLIAGTVEELLLVRANGVVAACMPDNAITLTHSDLEHYSKRLDALAHRGDIFPRVSDDGMLFYYNDGSYEYPNFE